MATVTLQRIEGFAEGPQRAIKGPLTGTLYIVNSLGHVTVDTTDAPYLLAQGWTDAFPGSGGGSSPTSGVATVDFGSFPGAGFASATVTAADPADPNAILVSQVVPIATADHSADEHLVDPPQVGAVNNGDGTITVSAVARQAIPQPGPDAPDPMPYGKWSVAWAFAP